MNDAIHQYRFPMTDKSHYEAAEALQDALHLALQIDPANTTDPTIREVWYTGDAVSIRV